MTIITAEESLTHVAVALIAEEFFIDEAEELEICFLPKFILFIYGGLTYWSMSIAFISPYLRRLHHSRQFVMAISSLALRGVHFYDPRESKVVLYPIGLF